MNLLCILPLLFIKGPWSSWSHAKMIRNSALMNQMMSHFQRENNLSLETAVYTTKRPKIKQDVQKSDKVITLMQHVLCKNFPAIPCALIMHDPTLNKLIARSIQQISNKQKTLERGFLLDRMINQPDQILARSVYKPEPETERNIEAPVTHHNIYVNSEDLSHFLSVSHTGYFKPKATAAQKRKKKKNTRATPQVTLKNYWSHERKPKTIKKEPKEAKHNEVYTGRKKMRKFYPHKIKYKDKNKNHGEFREYSDEKLSISVEVPDVTLHKKKELMTFRVEPSESPVWRLDYMKHGVPSLNMFGYEDEKLMGKLIKKQGINANDIANGNAQETHRKEVLHSDVYIKNNFGRKNTVNMNSDGLEN